MKIFLLNDNIKVELVDIFWEDKNKYRINEYVDIINEINNILSWKESNESFYRGGEYPSFKFLLNSDNNQVGLILTKHHSEQTLELKFFQNSLQRTYTKNIDSKYELEIFFNKLRK
jgi:hypothetical protein